MVLVADPRMLPLLRDALAPAVKAGISLRELARDYTWCTAAQLKRHLDAHGLLAARAA
jgi:protein required for attachment to host cells